MKKAVLFLMCVFIFSSCLDVTGPNEDELLFGNWLLTRITGGLAGQNIEVSPSEGRKVVFNYGGTVNYYSKDKLERSTSFTVKKGKSIYSLDEKNLIHFADSTGSPMVIMHITKDSLILGDNFYDGYNYVYLKEK